MILTTGHRGFIGSRLYKTIGGHGIDLKDGDNLLYTDLPQNIGIIFHLAAQSSVEDSWVDPMTDSDNLKMTVRLVHQYPNARIIYTNSAAAMDPKSPYGFSKWASAEYLKKFHRDYVVCMLPNVYGHGGRSVVDIFKTNKQVTVYGDGEQKRDYVHVSDIVTALIKAQDWGVGEYQLGTGIPTTVLDLAKGKEILFAPARKEARNSILKNTTPNWQARTEVLKYLHD